METIVVLGAAGRMGDAVARAFVEAGWRVKGLARNAKVADLAPGVEPVQADAADRAALIAACAGADVIFNGLNPLYTEWREKVLPMAENVIAAAEASGATHLLPGNVYNYGHAIGLNTDENAPFDASTDKAEIRIAMEGLFAERAKTRNVQTIVLRAGDFFGGPRSGTWHDLLMLTKLGQDVFTWPGPMDVPHAFAYLPDLGRAFVALAEKRSEIGRFETFHFAGHTMTGHDMKLATETAVGRKLVTKGMPWTLLRAAGLFSPMMRELVKMSYLWRTPHSLDGTKLERFVGRLPSTEPVEAVRQIVADLDLDPRQKVAA